MTAQPMAGPGMAMPGMAPGMAMPGAGPPLQLISMAETQEPGDGQGIVEMEFKAHSCQKPPRLSFSFKFSLNILEHK